MLKNISLLFSVALFLSACGNSDSEVSYIHADSTFSCAQLNESNALGNSGLTNRILTSAFNQLDKAYADDKAIQRFYRDLVRRNLDYAHQFSKGTIQACDGNSDKGVNQAATDALNTFYAEAMQDPRWATCRAFVDGTVDLDAIMVEISAPTTLTIGGDPSAYVVSVVHGAEGYGPDYLQPKIAERCEGLMDRQLWGVIGEVAAPVVVKLNEEARVAAAAERQQRLEAERAQRISLYSENLYSAGRATCPNFRKLWNLSRDRYDDDQAVYEAAFASTVRDIPRPVVEHQRAAFEEALQADYDRTIEQLTVSCSDDKSIEEAVLELWYVAEAKSPYYMELHSLLQEKSKADWCPPNSACDEALEHQAAQRAFDDGVACENNLSNASGLCFSVPAEGYDYHLALLRLERLRARLEAAKQELKEEPNSREMAFYSEPCKQSVIERGLRGDAYTAEVNRICPAAALKLYREPAEAELVSAEQAVEKQIAEVELARQKGVAAPDA